jgi:acyl carrier protein phosphodiesterase
VSNKNALEKLTDLKLKLKNYQGKWQSLKNHWNNSTSRYGDEYPKMQMKVYEDRINKIKQRIVEIKKQLINS